MIDDPDLVSIIEQRKPKHIIIGIGGGLQDKLGSYLKHQLSYRPGIYCIGAAARFCHWRPNRHSGVGRSIFCRLDIPPFWATAHLFARILEGAPIARIDFALWT